MTTAIYIGIYLVLYVATYLYNRHLYKKFAQYGWYEVISNLLISTLIIGSILMHAFVCFVVAGNENTIKPPKWL